MIERMYFMNAKCSEATGYCYSSRVTSYTSFRAQADVIYRMMTDELIKELKEIRPHGQFEVISFNRV